MAIETTVRLAGIVTLAGAVLYAIADILLLAYNVGPLQEIPSTAIDFETSERWKRRASMLTCMSKMPWKRLVAGGLLTRSFWNLIQLDTGFRAENVATVRLPIIPERY